MTVVKILVELNEGVFTATARDGVGVLRVSRAPVRALAVNQLRRWIMEMVSGPVHIVEEDLNNDTTE